VTSSHPSPKMIHVTNTLRAILLAAAAAFTQAATAATLSFDAPLQADPNEQSEILGALPAGSSVTPVLREELAAAGIAEPPPGWLAIRHTTTIEGFVRTRDIGKDLSIKPNSPILSEASENARVLATVGPKDPVETGDPVGRFSKATVRLERIAFINSVPPESRALVGQQVSVPPQPPTAPATTETPRPRTPSAPPAAITAAPRTFEGYLMRTRRILGRGPKLEYQLVDENNNRIALLDMSALLVTEPIEFFEGRMVKIYGPGLSMEGVTEAIIRVENLRLAR